MKNLLLAIMLCALLFCGYVQYFNHDSPSVSSYTELGKLVKSIEPIQERILECGTHLLPEPDGLMNDNEFHSKIEAIAKTEYSVEALDLAIDLNDMPDDIERAVAMVSTPSHIPEVDSKKVLKQAMTVLNNLKAEFVKPEKLSTK